MRVRVKITRHEFYIYISEVLAHITSIIKNTSTYVRTVHMSEAYP